MSSQIDEVLKEIKELKKSLKRDEKLELEEVDLKEWVVEGLGASLEATVASWINKYINLGDYAGVIAGYVIAKYLAPRVHPMLSTLGRGIAIASLGRIIGGFVGGVLPKAGVSTPSASSLEQIAQAYAGGG
jgi:hypothetical protein